MFTYLLERKRSGKRELTSAVGSVSSTCVLLVQVRRAYWLAKSKPRDKLGSYHFMEIEKSGQSCRDDQTQQQSLWLQRVVMENEFTTHGPIFLVLQLHHPGKVQLWVGDLRAICKTGRQTQVLAPSRAVAGVRSAAVVLRELSPPVTNRVIFLKALACATGPITATHRHQIIFDVCSATRHSCGGKKKGGGGSKCYPKMVI